MIWILFYVIFQLIYGYVETDDEIDDEINRNPVLQFNGKDYFTSHTTQTWYKIDMPLIPQYVQLSGRWIAFVQI